VKREKREPEGRVKAIHHKEANRSTLNCDPITLSDVAAYK
jgi:hypothetical protein